MSKQSSHENSAGAMAKPGIPNWLKWAFTGFMAVLVPFYWYSYGPTNFLYFCDIALFFALIGLWTERSIWASMAAVGITVPQLLWQVDFLSSLIGYPLVGMTAYMFDPNIPLFARALSFFHFWLPILLIYLVWKQGYDRRAFFGWTAVAWVAMLVAFFFLPAPGDVLAFENQPRNVNYVFGLDGDTTQTWMSPISWLGLMLIGLPVVFYAPTHWILRRLFTPS
ncbi:MAG: hypothetical protein AAF802_15460 [Planctomycetota bacterium]